MRIYLGAYVWGERPAGVFGWRMPTGATTAIDLRTQEERADRGTQPAPAKTVFVTPDAVVLPVGYMQLASDPQETLPAGRRRALADLFGGSAVAATRCADVIWELFTQRADPDGQVAAKPLMPRGLRRAGTLELVCGSVWKTAQLGPGMAEWPLIRLVHQRAYRAHRDAVIAGQARTGAHLRYLGALLQKYHIALDAPAAMLREFIAADLPLETPLRPTTTITESFPGTSGTLGGDLTWTEISSVWANVAGVGAHTPAFAQSGEARAESDLSSDDMYCEMDHLTEAASNYWGPMARFSASAVTGYQHNSNRASNDYYCSRIEAGSGTDIITSELSGSITLPTRDRIEVDGSTVEIFEGESTSRGATTDTAVTGHTRAGVKSYRDTTGTCTFDNWEAGDLGGPAPAPPSNLHIVHQSFRGILHPVGYR